MNLTRDFQNVFPRTKYLQSQISLPSSRKVRKHGKNTPFRNKINEYQEKKNLEERSYILHANNLGFWDINVQRGRHPTLKFFSEDDEERDAEEEEKLASQENGCETIE